MAAYIKTGEQTGCLDEILDSLSGHYEQEQETSGQIRSAVTYPLLMLGHDGNRNRCPSCQGTSDLPAGIPADGNGNERIFQPASECRQISSPVILPFF